MSRRPIPQIDSEALERLASQYPGSDRARREYSQADDAAAARAPGQPPAAAAAPVNAGGAPRRSFGVWSFLFALVALVAAAVSIALLFLVVATVLSVQWVVDLRERPQ